MAFTLPAWKKCPEKKMKGKNSFRTIAYVLAIIAGMAAFGPANAQQLPERQGFFDIRSAATVLNEGVHELEARLQLILSDDALEALNSGVPLTIALDFEVIRVRGLWLDSLDATLTFTYELEYRPLSQRYIVRNLNSGNQESFATLYSALNNLGRIQGLPVVDDALLDSESRYRLRLRARLSTKQYPAALRLLFFWRSQWQLESDWYEWTLAR